MSELTREDFLAAKTRPLTEIDVPEMEGSVYTLPMSAGEAEAFGDETTVSEMVCKYVVNSQGERIFTDEDLPMLQSHAFKLMNSIAKGVLKANGIGDDELEGN